MANLTYDKMHLMFTAPIRLAINVEQNVTDL